MKKKKKKKKKKTRNKIGRSVPVFESLDLLAECPHRRSFFSDNIIGDKQKPIMASFKVSSGLLSAFALVFAITLPTAVHGQPFAPTPAPANDGTSIDQGIAYLLMLLALVLTYIIHTIDSS
ncbi:hypothetical protein R6Q57_006792 [Mikania cordata]